MTGHRDFAKTPPRGWNSWDCYGTGVNEEQLLENARYMKAHLQQASWEYIVCDIQWYQPTAHGTDYELFAPLTMDGFSRLMPAVNRFPSAANGVGFRKIADEIHAMGLKFGIHIMRGIPRQAVHAASPILADGLTARDIASGYSVCPWNTDMYGVDARKPGAAEYYQSLFDLYAAWGVDYVKCDDISNTEFLPGNPYSAKEEIELIRRAIDRTGRPIVLSLSPGPAPLSAHEHLSRHANLWRISGDFWDSWEKLLAQFTLCRSWAAYGSEGAWPDCDMLPLGTLCVDEAGGHPRGRLTRFTFPEQQTMLSLWSVFRSPLMMGGVLPACDEKTLSLLTNEEALEPNTCGRNPREVFRSAEEKPETIVWASEGEACVYAAVFNLREEAASVELPFSVLSLPDKAYRVRDLWAKQDLGVFRGTVLLPAEAHGARLLKISETV